MNDFLTKKGVRIFRPAELQKLMKAIPRSLDLIRFETALYTGARFVELQLLKKHPEFFTGNAIRMTTKKGKAISDERYIKLNERGCRAVKQFLEQKKRMPAREGWNASLKRWCKYAGIDPTGVSAKSTRKTWESYLVTSFPSCTPTIFVSQGHTGMTSLQYYLTLGFTDDEIKDIKKITEAWI
jgi:integrase